jgi:hypothetical protein
MSVYEVQALRLLAPMLSGFFSVNLCNSLCCALCTALFKIHLAIASSSGGSTSGPLVLVPTPLCWPRRPLLPLSSPSAFPLLLATPRPHTYRAREVLFATTVPCPAAPYTRHKARRRKAKRSRTNNPKPTHGAQNRPKPLQSRAGQDRSSGSGQRLASRRTRPTDTGTRCPGTGQSQLPERSQSECGPREARFACLHRHT